MRGLSSTLLFEKYLISSVSTPSIWVMPRNVSLSSRPISYQSAGSEPSFIKPSYDEWQSKSSCQSTLIIASSTEWIISLCEGSLSSVWNFISKPRWIMRRWWSSMITSDSSVHRISTYFLLISILRLEYFSRIRKSFPSSQKSQMNGKKTLLYLIHRNIVLVGSMLFSPL